MILYKSVYKEAIFEETIEKSKFITYIKPVETREEADEFIRGIKKVNKDATHNVPALVLGNKMEIQWMSDDGEPQGTAGMPILSTLVNEGITNVAVVITRYFGGKKLGTGGLVRAYTSGTKGAIKEAGIAFAKECGVIKFRLDYTFLSQIQKEEKTSSFEIKDIIYEEKIILECLTDRENVANIIKHIREITNGRAEVIGENYLVTRVSQ